MTDLMHPTKATALTERLERATGDTIEVKEVDLAIQSAAEDIKEELGYWPHFDNAYNWFDVEFRASGILGYDLSDFE